MNFANIVSVAGVFAVSATAGLAQSSGGARGVEFGASTLGFYASADYELTNNVAVRVPVYYANYENEFDLDGNDLDTEIGITSLSAMLDFYLPNTGLRMSSGVSFGGYSLKTNSVEEVEFSGQTYTADFQFEVEQTTAVAPTIAVGYRKVFNDTWGLSAELGARMAQLELSASGQDELPDSERDEFNENIDDFNDDLKSVGVIPFLSLGLNFRF